MLNSFLQRIMANKAIEADFTKIEAFAPTLNDQDLINKVNKHLKFSGKPTSAAGSYKFAVFPCQPIKARDVVALKDELTEQGWKVMSLAKFQSMGMECIALSMACHVSPDLKLNLVQVSSDLDIVRLQTLKGFQ